jgi:hypothetical protein
MLSESSSAAQRTGSGWLDNASLAERGQLLQRLLNDSALAATSDYEQALQNVAAASAAPRIERLAGRLLLRLVDAAGNMGGDNRAGASAGLLVTARAMGLSVAEMVAGALRHNVPALSIDEQVSHSSNLLYPDDGPDLHLLSFHDMSSIVNAL